MRILQLCHRVPFPPKDGGTLAVNNLTEGFIRAGHSVRVLAINTLKHYSDVSFLPSSYLENTGIRTATTDTSISPVKAFQYLFKKGSYNIDRFYTRDFEDLISELLRKERFDIIQLESIFLTPYLPVIRKLSTARVVLRSHNVEYEIWKKKAFNCGNFLKRLYLRHLASRLESYEVRHLNLYDAIVPISSNDERIFFRRGCRIPMHTAPFGVNLEEYTITGAKSPPSVFFIGSLDWEPNLEGLSWFLTACWPDLHKRMPWLKFRIAGRNISKKLLAFSAPNVEIIGEVPSARDFINENSVMIVPLFSGSGMRIKIIEGLALGKTVVSTSLGAEGIEYRHAENILIADSSEDFCNLVENSVTDPEQGRILGQNGRRLVEEKYSNDLITGKLLDFYQNLLDSENTGTSFQNSVSA